MTTLLDDRGAMVVRCDACRRLWPVTRERLEAVWERDDSRDLHRCPVCAHPAPPPGGSWTPGPARGQPG